MGKLSNAQKAAIYQAWKDGVSQSDLAKQYGVTTAAICQLVKKLNKAGESIGIKPAASDPKVETAALPEQLPEKKPAAFINPEFDAAVNAMVADLHEKDADAEENAANAEKKSVFAEVSQPVPDPEPELEDVENGIPNTPLAPNETAKQPAAVRRAIEFRIRDIEEKIEARVSRIRELKEELTDLRRESAELLAWKEKQKWK